MHEKSHKLAEKWCTKWLMAQRKKNRLENAYDAIFLREATVNRINWKKDWVDLSLCGNKTWGAPLECELSRHPHTAAAGGL